jgi:hypothetical protein
MKESELLAKLSIQEDGPKERLVMYEGQDQIAYEDAPDIMLVDFSYESLIENGEFAQDVALALQEHRKAVKQWIADRGFKVEDVTDESEDPGSDGPFGDGSEEDEDGC